MPPLPSIRSIRRQGDTIKLDLLGFEMSAKWTKQRPPPALCMAELLLPLTAPPDVMVEGYRCDVDWTCRQQCAGIRLVLVSIDGAPIVSAPLPSATGRTSLCAPERRVAEAVRFKDYAVPAFRLLVALIAGRQALQPNECARINHITISAFNRPSALARQR